MAVLVLYRCPLETSRTWLTLLPQIQRLPDHCRFTLLLCVNETTTTRPESLPDWVAYQVRERNEGLAWAYNAGLAMAADAGVPWMLTLDQDTRLPEDFLEHMFARGAALLGRVDVAAIVPELVSSEGEVYSPFMAKTGHETTLPSGFCGVAKGDVRAFNSGALMRVAWLRSHDGYNSCFWLDFLDHAVFRTITRSGGRVWVAGDIRVEHHLSIAEDRGSMTQARFRNFLEAEAASIDWYGTAMEQWLHTMRLAARIWNQRRRGDPALFMEETKALLYKRLTASKSKRLAEWKAAQVAHTGSDAGCHE